MAISRSCIYNYVTGYIRGLGYNMVQELGFTDTKCGLDLGTRFGLDLGIRLDSLRYGLDICTMSGLNIEVQDLG